MAHTPGPWEARNWRVVNDYRVYPIKVICDTATSNATRTAENMANACLIAAAPELLAACEGIVLWCETEGISSPAAEMARKAIEKAAFVGTVATKEK